MSIGEKEIVDVVDTQSYFVEFSIESCIPDLFYLPYGNSAKNLYMELSEDGTWDPRWIIEFWGWSMNNHHIWLVEDNLGDRSKSGKWRVKHFKHECERYMREMKGLKHTREKNTFLYPSNMYLQVFVKRLKDSKFSSFDGIYGWEISYLQDSRTNLFEEGGNDRDQVASKEFRLHLS